VSGRHRPEQPTTHPGRTDESAHWTAVNQCWCGDITYVKTRDGWAYLATVIDLHSRAVVGWAITDHDMALTHRAPAGVISIAIAEPGIPHMNSHNTALKTEAADHSGKPVSVTKMPSRIIFFAYKKESHSHSTVADGEASRKGNI
jgi:transposase InsO family protein